MLVLLLLHPFDLQFKVFWEIISYVINIICREKYITVVQSLHTPPNPHGPSSRKQQGGWKRTDIYYCDEQYLIRLIQTIAVVRKIRQEKEIKPWYGNTYHVHEYSFKKCRRERKSSKLHTSFYPSVLKERTWSSGGQYESFVNFRQQLKASGDIHTRKSSSHEAAGLAM